MDPPARELGGPARPRPWWSRPIFRCLAGPIRLACPWLTQPTKAPGAAAEAATTTAIEARPPHTAMTAPLLPCRGQGRSRGHGRCCIHGGEGRNQGQVDQICGRGGVLRQRFWPEPQPGWQRSWPSPVPRRPRSQPRSWPQQPRSWPWPPRRPRSRARPRPGWRGGGLHNGRGHDRSRQRPHKPTAAPIRGRPTGRRPHPRPTHQ